MSVEDAFWTFAFCSYHAVMSLSRHSDLPTLTSDMGTEIKKEKEYWGGDLRVGDVCAIRIGVT